MLAGRRSNSPRSPHAYSTVPKHKMGARVSLARVPVTGLGGLTCRRPTLLPVPTVSLHMPLKLVFQKTPLTTSIVFSEKLYKTLLNPSPSALIPCSNQEERNGGENSLMFLLIHYEYIYIYKSQFNLPNILQLYMTSFLIGYNCICKVDICYNIKLITININQGNTYGNKWK